MTAALDMKEGLCGQTLEGVDNGQTANEGQRFSLNG